MKKKILYAVLNWGLGHATRSMPIIRELKKKNEVIIISTGRALTLLRSEFPKLEAIDYPDYSIKYTNNDRLFFISLALQVPKILFGLHREQKYVSKITKEKNIDIIISDNRYGVYSKIIPSFFITHQLKFKLPKSLKYFEGFTEYFNEFFFSKFKKIFIPDYENDPNFSGELSHGLKNVGREKLRFIGLLSDSVSMEKIESDYLFIISGPEPQRTKFEKLVIEQINDIKGKKIVLLGKTEINDRSSNGDIDIYSHSSREEISKMINGAGMIISRSGYSTVMEVVAAGKRALFIPTPGQTEQEYLADYYKRKGLFHFVSQKDMNLKKNIPEAKKYNEILKQKVNEIETILKEIDLT